MCEVGDFPMDSDKSGCWHRPHPQYASNIKLLPPSFFNRNRQNLKWQNAKFRPLLNDHTKKPLGQMVHKVSRPVWYAFRKVRKVATSAEESCRVLLSALTWSNNVGEELDEETWALEKEGGAGVWGAKRSNYWGNPPHCPAAEVIILDFYGAAEENSLRHVQQNVERNSLCYFITRTEAKIKMVGVMCAKEGYVCYPPADHHVSPKDNFVCSHFFSSTDHLFPRWVHCCRPFPPKILLILLSDC